MHGQLRSRIAAVFIWLILVATPFGSRPAAAAGGFLMYIDGAPGDMFGNGAVVQLALTNGEVNSIDEGLTQVGAIGLTGDGGDYWGIGFAAPSGATLTADTTYVGVSGTLAVHGLGGCPDPGPNSSFTVHETGVATFAASFEYHCDGASGSLRGFVRGPDATTDVVALLQSGFSVTFADTVVGQTSTSTDFVFSSAGTTAAHVTTIELTGPGSADFQITDETCTDGPIASGDACTVSVSFVPTITGPRTATLLLDDDTIRGARSIALNGFGTAPSSAVSWGSRRNVGALYTWSYGSHLAQTVSPTKTYLHDVATTDRVNDQWVDNNGPYLGVMYVRGNASGSSWSTPFRVNPRSQHGDRAVIASSGRYIYVVWERIAKYINYDPNAPRTLYFRRNTSHGASGSWSGRLGLTSTTGRVGLPSVAAAGGSVYVAYTDATNGNVRLAASSDRGATWTTSTIGSTALQTVGGFEALPTVAAAGSNVIVSWTGDDAWSVVTRISTNAADSWSPSTIHTTTAEGSAAAAARDARLGVTWMAEDGARFQLWTNGTWGEISKIGPPYDNVPLYVNHRQPALTFGGSGQIGISWTACREGCAGFTKATREDLFWAESNDDGVNWFKAQVLRTGENNTWQIHDASSIVWPSSNVRTVAWNSYKVGGYYRMVIRSGTGTN